MTTISGRIPRDTNHVPVLAGVSSSDLTTPTLVAVDPATHRLLVSSTGGGGGGSDVQYTDGDDVTIATGNMIVYDNAGLAVHVSTDAGLPVSLVSPVTLPVSVQFPENRTAGNITTQNLVPAGTATAASAVSSQVPVGSSSASAQVSGTYTGALSLQIIVDTTSGTWVTVGGKPFTDVSTGVASATIPSGAQSIYTFACPEADSIRVTALAAVTGTARVELIVGVSNTPGLNVQNGSGAGAVNIQDGGNSITIDGTITANAGTNLNTSALALEAGNLATLAGGVSSSVYQANLKQVNGVTTQTGTGTAGTGTQRVAVASDSSIVLATGSAQIGHLESNQSTNTAQINGVTPLMGNGASGTGAQRVTIASDSTGIIALTTGAAQIGHLEANQSTNVAQINGVTTLMGNGVTGTGSQRVTIASDNTAFGVNATLSAETTKVIGTVNQGTSPWVTSNATTSVVGNGTAATAQRVSLASDSTGQVTLATGANTIGALTANQSVNVAQINGVTTLMGNGATGTGSQRVTIASDNTAFSVNVASEIPGTGATNLGKAEDAAHTTGDTGVFTLGVRNDTLADVTNTSADYSQLSTDIKGRVMTAGAPRSLKGTAQVSLSNTTSETTVISATASTFHDVYGLILANTGASTTKVSIRDDTAGTVRAIIEVPTLETRGFMLAVDSAVPQTAVNKNWTAQCGTATTALEVTAFYVSMV